MSNRKPYPTQERLKELFDYREDGQLIRKVKVAFRVNVGDVAGSIDKASGYCYIRVDYNLCAGHRLIWIWHYGYDPENDVDHYPDRTRSNNRIENLREATRSCNSRNTGNRKNNTSKVKGVSWANKDKKWRAEIKTMGYPKFLGCHDDFNEAVLHRLAGEQCLDWEGCDSSSPAYKYVVKHNLINMITRNV